MLEKKDKYIIHNILVCSMYEPFTNYTIGKTLFFPFWFIQWLNIRPYVTLVLNLRRCIVRMKVPIPVKLRSVLGVTQRAPIVFFILSPHIFGTTVGHHHACQPSPVYSALALASIFL
jgi:hypothetical protein